MELHSTVEIYDRNLLSQKKSKSVILTFSTNDEGNSICLYLQTQDNQGTKYQIANNIVFEKFKNVEHKVTIRVIQPCHDIIIQSNAIQLKSFFDVLKQLTYLRASKDTCKCHITKYHIRHAITSITSLSSKQFSSLQRTKIVIKRKSEYPILQGFRKTAEQLFLSGLDKRFFDRQILRLQTLRILILSNNKISSLPKELGTLPHLQQLDVSQNFLGRSAQSTWAWIEQSAVKNNLRLLDISNNSLTKLPAQIGKLQGLVTLKIRQNLLTHLPQSIGTLRHLKYLDVAKNSLLYLPAIIARLGLKFVDFSKMYQFKVFSKMYQFKDILEINQSIDISENPFPYPDNYDSDSAYKLSEVNVDMRRGTPSLAELSAKCVIKSRLTYASLLPLPLVKYLDEFGFEVKYCWTCRNACFDRYIRKIINKKYMNNIPIYFINHHYCIKCIENFTNEVRAIVRGAYCVEYYFCSLKCYSQFMLAYY